MLKADSLPYFSTASITSGINDSSVVNESAKYARAVRRTASSGLRMADLILDSGSLMAGFYLTFVGADRIGNGDDRIKVSER